MRAKAPRAQAKDGRAAPGQSATADSDQSGVSNQALRGSLERGHVPPALIPHLAASGLGNQAVQRMVGFEIETQMRVAQVAGNPSKADLAHAATDDSEFRKRSYLAHGAPLIGAGGEVLEALKKKEEIVGHRASNDPFTAEADEQADSGVSYLEYVTRPFDDTRDDAQALSRAMASIVAMHAYLLGRGTKAGQVTPVRSKDLSRFGTPTHNRVILASGSSSTGTVQASVGLRLDRVAKLMTRMGGKQPNETDQTTAKLTTPRRLLGRGLSSPENVVLDDTNANITGAAPRFAEAAIDEFRKPAHGLAALGDGAGNRDKLVGFIALLVQYVVSGQNVATYAKTMAPLMARTDFVALFNQLSTLDRAYLSENGGQVLADIVLFAAGRRGSVFAGNVALIPSVYGDVRYQAARAANLVTTNMLAGLTREQWLKGIATGTDFLTEASFRTAVPAAVAHAEEHIEGMGALGNLTNPVGAAREAGSVFEIRTAGGVLDYKMWYTHALDIFRYIRDLNDGKNVEISDTIQHLRASEDPLYNQLILSNDPKVFQKGMKQIQKRVERDLKARFT